MIRVMAINGSPRKKWNTAQLLDEALNGAREAGAATERVDLFDLNYSGCVSCFACKRKESWNLGKCAIVDDLSPVIERVLESQVLIMGSPIYFSDVTGVMRSFWERLWFSNMAYDESNYSVFNGTKSVGLVYTMNIPEEAMKEWGYINTFEGHRRVFSLVFNGPVENLAVCDTVQFDDYAKYHAPRFDPEHKARHKSEVFAKDLRRAFDMGHRLATAMAGVEG